MFNNDSIKSKSNGIVIIGEKPKVNNMIDSVAMVYFKNSFKLMAEFSNDEIVKNKTSCYLYDDLNSCRKGKVISPKRNQLLFVASTSKQETYKLGYEDDEDGLVKKILQI